MHTFCRLCYAQDTSLPYIQSAVAASRNKANRTLEVLEPWQIAACTVCATLVTVWIFEFLFMCNESTSFPYGL